MRLRLANVFWRYVLAVLPGIVDLILEPFKNMVGLRFVLERINRDFAGMERNELPMHLERHRWRFLDVAVPIEYGIQVGQRLADVFVKMGDAVQGLETVVALRPEYFLMVASQKHSSLR
jgi:hypothetical protein